MVPGLALMLVVVMVLMERWLWEGGGKGAVAMDVVQYFKSL